MPEVETAPRRGVRREDPPPRPVEQTANRGFLDQARPDKHYVFVSEVNDPTINVGHYLAQGYKISQFDPDDPKPTIGYVELKQGDAIKAHGMVLMELPMEQKLALDKKGWDAADRIQETIRHRELDPLTPEERAQFRGITSTRTDQDDRRKWQF